MCSLIVVCLLLARTYALRTAVSIRGITIPALLHTHIRFHVCPIKDTSTTTVELKVKG